MVAKTAQAEPKKPMAVGKKTKYEAGPKSLHYEFAGPLGALGVTLSVPFFSYWLQYACGPTSCSLTPLSTLFSTSALKDPSFYHSLWDNKAAGVYLGWYVWTVVCWGVLPGTWVKGCEMRNGEKLGYKINAFPTILATMLGVAGITYTYGPGPLVYIADNLIPIVSATLVMSVVQAVYCYASSFGKGKMLALGGNTGNVLYDWFIGRELNPRIGSFDIKTFNELRPGLIMWFIIDLAYAAKQYTLLGRITDSMILVTSFHGWYVFDALYNESAILSQMDITTDGFGFMLSVGDLTWVPLTYSYQARYLCFWGEELGWLKVGGVVGVQFLGYWIFRTANGEKNDFRNGKNPKNLTFMETQRGTKLLTSGWWGRSRHPNYLGDWTMAWAWCLPTGFSTPLPYFYVVFFAILLVHRQMRDDEACEKKYGADWKKYCKLVPSRIIPGIY